VGTFIAFVCAVRSFIHWQVTSTCIFPVSPLVLVLMFPVQFFTGTIIGICLLFRLWRPFIYLLAPVLDLLVLTACIYSRATVLTKTAYQSTSAQSASPECCLCISVWVSTKPERYPGSQAWISAWCSGQQPQHMNSTQHGYRHSLRAASTGTGIGAVGNGPHGDPYGPVRCYEQHPVWISA
jgi:hypothetical protein